MKPRALDQHPDLGPGAAESDYPPAGAHTPREHREIEHQRGIGEDQLGEIDDHIALRADRSDQRGAARALRAPVLVAATAKYRRLVIKDDDSPAKLLKMARA